MNQGLKYAVQVNASDQPSSADNWETIMVYDQKPEAFQDCHDLIARCAYRRDEVRVVSFSWEILPLPDVAVSPLEGANVQSILPGVL